MTRALILAPLTLSLFACGQPALDNGQSGSRLKARFVAAEGGALRFLQFVDTETNEPCALRSTVEEQEVAHCLPRPNAWLVYADDACSRRLVQLQQETDHVWITATDYTNPTAGYRRGSPVRGLSKVYYKTGKSSCVEWGFEPSNWPVFEIAEQRDLGRWPRGTLEVTTPSDQLKSTLFIGDDGSRGVWDVVDTRSGSQCRPGETEAGPRCVPEIDSSRHVDEGLRSADCSQKYIVDYSAGPVSLLGDEPGEIHRMMALGSETAVAKLVDGECILQDPPQLGRKSLFLAEPYPASEWPVVQLQQFGGPGLIAELASVSEESVNPLKRSDTFELFKEPARNGQCGPAWVDKVLRCVFGPSRLQRWNGDLYADPQCTVPAVLVWTGEEPPPVVQRLMGLSSPAAGGLPELELYEVGDQLDSTAYIRKADGSCIPSTSGNDAYALGARLPATEFPPLRLMD